MEVRPPQGPVQRAFSGLVGLLGLKGPDVIPNSIAGFVQPVLETQHMLAFERLRIRSEDGLTVFQDAGFVGTTVNLTVPLGKIWILRSASILIPLDATDALRSLGVSLRAPPGGGTGVEYLSSEVVNIAAAIGGNAVATFSAPQPLLMSAGTSLGANYGGLVAAPAPIFRIVACYSEIDA